MIALTLNVSNRSMEEFMYKMLLAGLALIAVMTSCGGAMVTTYKSTLNGANEKPAAISPAGTGSATATLDGTTLNLKIDYAGLTGAATVAHIHGLADENNVAGVLCDFTDKIAAGASATVGTGTISATCNLDGVAKPDLTVANLNAGKFYINVHSAKNTGGEIRGQLIKQ